MKIIVTFSALVLLVGCATVRQTVRQQDLDAWVGQPVVALEVHPVFITVPVIKTTASDGTEIWNYVNGRNLGSCSGGGSVFAGTVNYAIYSKFVSCMHTFAACNNIFIIRDGVVEKYTPIGTGGAHCYTTEALQPGFSEPTNLN